MRRFDLGFELRGRAEAFKAKMLRGIFVNDFLVGRRPDHPKAHRRRIRFGVERRPARLVNELHIFHFESRRAVVGTDDESARRNRHDPVKTRFGNRGMKIVNLIGGNSLSPKKRQSYMRERAFLRGSRRPVFALHISEIRRRRPEGDAIAFVVGSHSRKSAAPGDLTFEMVDV